MTAEKISQSQWQPRQRPEWVETINTAARGLDIRGIVPLDADDLIATAIKNTGHSDFGSEDWREPFHILAKSIDEESDPNLIGRIMTRQGLLISLEARLNIEATYKDHPEIDDQEIVKPIIIMGSIRTGTSAVHNILGADPDNQVPLLWENWFPCPPPETATYDTDPRREKADRVTWWWDNVTPEFPSMHEQHSDLPVEDEFFHQLAFRSPLMGYLGKTPSYLNWMATADMTPASEYFKRTLKLLQWKHKRKRWVLKSPAFAIPFDLTFKTFPDAMVVHTHRDPLKSTASGEDLLNTIHWQRSDNYLAHRDIYKHFTSDEALAGAMNRNIDELESGSVPKRQIFNLLFSDFVRDNIAAVRSIYAYFGIESSEDSFAAMARYMEKNHATRNAHPMHKYADPPAHEIARRRPLFRRYQEYFGVPNEM